MQEKIFGKKSTGVVYILCVAALLLSFAGSFAAYFFLQKGSLLLLIEFAAFILLEIALMSLPVFVQKKFMLYIPPSVEIGICVYSVLFFFSRSIYLPKTNFFASLLPPIGGFVLAMTIFCIVRSLADHRGEKTGRQFSPLFICITTFAISAFCVLIFNLFLCLFAWFSSRMPEGEFLWFLTFSLLHWIGIAIFCVIGFLSMHSQNHDAFRIFSFKNLNPQNLGQPSMHSKTQSTVIRNLREDTTNYKDVFHTVKAKFFFLRILYLGIYAGYLVFAGFAFIKLGTLGLLIIGSLLAGFLLISLVYVYEYFLYTRSVPNQRLRKLKIAKTAVRVYTLLLLFFASVLSDHSRNELSVLISNILFIINFCSFFYNVFGKPKTYPPAK